MTSKNSSRTCTVNGCGNGHYGLGFCQKHYKRLKKNGSPHPEAMSIGPAARTDEERFWAKVDKCGPDACWEWTASKNKNGYGYMRYGRAMGSAHRVAWELMNGEIPQGEGYHGTCVLHRCDNPPCVNPSHLFLGTMSDNNADMMGKGRNRQPKGEAHKNSKLTESDVLNIRRRYFAGGIFQKELANDYKVGQTLISQIIRRVGWRHI